MSLRIFIALDGEDQGSFSADELAELWEQGDIDPAALFWHRGRQGWSTVGEYRRDGAGDRFLAADVRLSTTHEIPGETVEHEVDIVSADVVEGFGSFSELLASVTDIVGGRSATTEQAIARARAEALDRLRRAVRDMRADAVIGLRVSFEQISNRAILMLVVTATGTAVRLVPRPPPIP